MTLPKYVLITPARNEAEFIELTIQSVVAQTVRPERWVIVSDGSTDDTNKIVSRYAGEHPWIKLLRMPERRERHFAGKVHAFNAGYAKLDDISYEVIGNLDADISFESEYFSYLLRKLAEDASLGVVGTPFSESGQSYDYRFTNIEHVSGACQLFRRKCFEDIGGYLPLKGGGIDLLAVIKARMNGWATRTFTEKTCLHHRGMGTAQHDLLATKFNYGSKDFVCGNHPVWELFRTVYQMTQKPIVIGGLALFFGYVWAVVRGAERSLSRDMIVFVRREQMRRLRRFLMGNRKSPRNEALRPPHECM